MSKFICLMLCIIGASSYVRANPTLRDLLIPISQECFKEFPRDSVDVVNKAAETGDAELLDPCFSGCVFKKAGFINDKGEYDTNSALINLRKLVTDDEQYAGLAAATNLCTSVQDTVTDGEAGCERGARLSACLLQQRDYISI
ncbi:hypothetical protein PYW08_011732 [Mythimna loreyi]|uniref:Uncharacterized protein n=1 Tax=Mythimna loreyi TaxID=667449 RepID=A0ACC2QMC6_9NEOP|nr:hypothetical protein PYW08_011732 [Mythimna loreyi]